MSWLAISAVAAALVALVLAYLLIKDWLADRAYRSFLREMSDEAERVIRHGDQCPWNVK